MTTEERLWEWVRKHLALVRGVAPESVTLDKALSSYGLDSVDAVLMAGELEEAFGLEIEPARFIACDSFREIIASLVADVDQAEKQRASL
jgi:phthiocerol/phenolphthiocerol synthesis type-I polyketide synthase B